MKNNQDMSTKYLHTEVEAGKYDYWLKNGYFTSGDKTKKPYAMVIPPPNVTGRLHLGHAWDTTIQDIIIRQKRMQGYDAVWLPGMDHAGIATQARIDAKLKANGISRYEIGREKFLEVAWDWKKEYAQTIREQWAALGLSLDYTKERFTLDEGLSKAVREVFIRYYNEGLIYRGERIINWDVESKTALSNIEVEYQEIEGAFYHILYPFTDGSGALEIATTRPETMFGDTALMVHPTDDRYLKAIGKMVKIPLTDREIPVISDEYVEKEFGTGVVKVTPAHDPNDFEVGNRHQLPRILCMNEDGTMNEYAGKYQGMDRFACREAVIKDLQAQNLCPQIEKMMHSVGHSERTGVMIEPRLSKQWFVKMDVLANDVLEMQKTAGAIDFIPIRFAKTFANWLENIQDWCISRQLWWGHRIPAWYKDDEVFVGEAAPGDDWVQDEDVLDTWFSSALWPFSTFGWPETTDDLNRYFPNDILVTGYDIIFFWVARMAFQARHLLGVRPFKKCLLHGLIRDEQGRKMSKSLGNGIDPFDTIAEYGCDALRYFITTGSTPGQDIRYSPTKMASCWNYINKIWNISRYIQINLKQNNYQDQEIDNQLLSVIDEWILAKMNDLITNATIQMDNYEFSEAARLIYNFVWDDFASWYVELTKVVFSGADQKAIINTCAVLKTVLVNVLKLLHPYIPFVTEEIYQHFVDGSIMVTEWPQPYAFDAQHQANLTGMMLDIITNIRNLRSENNIANKKPLELYLETKMANDQVQLLALQPYFERMANIVLLTTPLSEPETVIVLDSVTLHLVKAQLIDLASEKERLTKEYERLNNEVERSEKMLHNPNFIDRAPAEKVAIEKQKYNNYCEQLQKVKELLEGLN